MQIFLKYAFLLRDFIVNTLVPFFTTVPDGIDTSYLGFTFAEGFTLRTYTIPWFFGDVTIGEFCLTIFIPTVIVIRLLKFLWDAIPLV